MFDIDLGTPVSDFVDWLTSNFRPLFDALSTIMLQLVNAVLFVLTAPHELVVPEVFTVLAVRARRLGFAIFTLISFRLIQAMGLWIQAMESLAVVVVASTIAVAIGVPIGIWAARGPVASAVVRPVLDFMQ